MPESEISWDAPDSDYRKKDVSWYWLTIVVAVIILAVAIWQKNFLFGFFVFIAEILVLVWADKKPATVKFKLNEKGLALGKNKFYSYSELASFGLDDETNVEWPEITLRFKNYIRPSIKVKLPKNRLSEVKKALEAASIPKTDVGTSFFDTLEKLIKF